MHKYELPPIHRERPKEVLDKYFENHKLKNNGRELSESQLAAMMTAKGLAMGQSTINRIRKKKLYPDVENALKFSMFFHMDLPTFLGIGFWVSPPPDAASAEAKEIVAMYDQLSPYDRKTIDRVVSALHQTTSKKEKQVVTVIAESKSRRKKN